MSDDNDQSAVTAQSSAPSIRRGPLRIPPRNQKKVAAVGSAPTPQSIQDAITDLSLNSPSKYGEEPFDDDPEASGDDDIAVGAPPTVTVIANDSDDEDGHGDESGSDGEGGPPGLTNPTHARLQRRNQRPKSEEIRRGAGSGGKTWQENLRERFGDEDDGDKTKRRVSFGGLPKRTKRNTWNGAPVSADFSPFITPSASPGGSVRSSRANSINSSRRDSREIDPKVVDAYVRLDKRSSRDMEQEEEIPLEDEWVWYFDHNSGKKGVKSKTYEETVLQEIGEFGTVQGFWRYWNNMVDVYDLPMYSNLRMFKKGIKPLWEDPNCINGGRWYIPFKDKDVLNILFTELILAIIGNRFDIGDELCGIILATRPKKDDNVVIWNKDKDKSQKVLTLIQSVCAECGIDPPANMVYHELNHALKYNNNFKPKKKKGRSRGSSPEGRRSRGSSRSTSRNTSRNPSRNTSPTRNKNGRNNGRRRSGGRGSHRSSREATPNSTPPSSTGRGKNKRRSTGDSDPRPNAWGNKPKSAGSRPTPNAWGTSKPSGAAGEATTAASAPPNAWGTAGGGAAAATTAAPPPANAWGSGPAKAVTQAPPAQAKRRAGRGRGGGQASRRGGGGSGGGSGGNAWGRPNPKVLSGDT